MKDRGKDDLDDVEERLRRLFELAEWGIEAFTESRESDEPSYSVGMGEDAMVFKGEGLRLLHDLSRDLTSNALEGGRTPRAVENALTRAVRVAHESSSTDNGLESFESYLSQSPKNWTIIDPVNAYFKGDELHLGRCIVYSSVELAHSAPSPLEHLKDDFPAAVIRADVSAEDRDAARYMASEWIEEALAIATVVEGPSEPADVAHPHIIGTDGNFAYASGHSDILVLSQVQDSNGQLYPPYRALSNAAAKPEEERSDWETRAIAASRWFREARRAIWLSKAIASAMTSLECLFVEGKKVKTKGKVIAERVSSRWTLRGMTAETQREWLSELYQSRNSVVHEGGRFTADADLRRLLVLTHGAVYWAAAHLDEWHRGTRDGPCLTIDEALGPHD